MPLLRTASVPFDDYSPAMRFAQREILGRFGDVVTIKPKQILKFGRNTTLATSNETIWNAADAPISLANEAYVSTNAITHFSSSSASDTQTLTIEGHTISGSNFTFTTQNVTLNGQTKTSLTTPLARVSRAYNTGSTALVGTVSVYEDVAVASGVPGTASAVHIVIAAGEQQSGKAATTLSSVDYGLLTSWRAGVNQKTNASADFRLEVRESGGVFRLVDEIEASANSGHISVHFDPYIIIPKNADIRVTGLASTTNVDVSAQFQAYFGLVS